jgi:hypothetical protein
MTKADHGDASKSDPIDILLGDPFREVTRKERRALLGSSTVAIALAWTGLVPEKVSALGVDLSPRNKAQFLTLVAGVMLYFMIAFVAYAASDFVAWRLAYSRLRDRLEWEEAEQRWKAEEEGARNVIMDIAPLPNEAPPQTDEF